MCEILAIHAEQPIAVEEVLRYATLLDEYGVAGFSWGITWRTDSGYLKRYKAVEGIRRDPIGLKSLSGVMARQYLVHLRRPSLMSTISFVNAQPYLDIYSQIAFAHNGYFTNHREFRSYYQTQVVGTSDSEIGFLHYNRLLQTGLEAGDALCATHDELGGDANIAVMTADGSMHFYAGHHDNAVYAFRINDAKFVATALHSADDYVLQVVFPNSESAERVQPKTVFSL